MQEFSPLYGLKVGIDDERHIRYMDTKLKLEKVFHQMADIAPKSQYTDMVTNSIPLSNASYLTFCIKDKTTIGFIKNRKIDR